MIKSGGSFYYKGKSCIIGAIILLNGLHYLVAASHIFSRIGDHLEVNGMQVAVTRILKDLDLALVELPSGCEVELTNLGNAAVLEDAILFNEIHSIRCRVLSAGASLIYLSFPCSDMPQPGDSGSPILQSERVIGLISSALLTDCIGVAISTNVLLNMRGFGR